MAAATVPQDALDILSAGYTQDRNRAMVDPAPAGWDAAYDQVRSWLDAQPAPLCDLTVSEYVLAVYDGNLEDMLAVAAARG